MWRLFNKLFGWDYAMVEWGYSYVIRKVQRSNGYEFCYIYGTLIVRDKSGREWIPLTYSNQ